MKRMGSVMYLYEGQASEYEKRHNELWPEMKEILKKYGASNYSIFLNPETNQLFAYLEVENEEKYSKIGEEPICQKWWAYMEPLMETKEGVPVSTLLQQVFYLP